MMWVHADTTPLPPGSWPVVVDEWGIEHPVPADDHVTVPGTFARLRVYLPADVTPHQAAAAAADWEIGARRAGERSLRSSP